MTTIKQAFLSLIAMTAFMTSCTKKEETGRQNDAKFDVFAESFSDIQVLRYQVPGWEELTLQQKTLAYYLYEAALAGRDIIYDQLGKHNLEVRKTIEAIYSHYAGAKSGDQWQAFVTYAGRIWFSNGIHHHYASDKILPDFTEAYFTELIQNTDASLLPLQEGETKEDLMKRLRPVLFDKNYHAKKVNLKDGIDNIVGSANNFYEGVTQKEVEDFYNAFPTSDHEPEWGLNSKLVKENGQLVEKVWKVGGMYDGAISKTVYWLEKAITVAENDAQAKALRFLVEYYQTGDLKKWDEYNIAWVADTASRIDVVNGFVEVYDDAIGKKGSYESVVSMKDMEASKRIEAIAAQAQWFEDNAPLVESHKKKEVKGISAKAITVIIEGGAATPSTPIGINLPNNNWVRKDHGSKSVSLSNIVHSYNESSTNSGFLDEFGLNDEVKTRMRAHGTLASDLHTDMHECIGHASGQINPGIATPDKTLKNYASCLEEARADLVALYYILDSKLIEIGVMSTLDVGKAEYDTYMMNGLMTQLTRIKLGDDIEEAHMRNRALVAYWALEKGKEANVVEFVKRDDKTYVQVNDYEKLRTLFGDLLREIQRIKSEGDFEAGKNLVETYAVKVNQELHKEVLTRFEKLGVKPYKGFIQPKLVPVMDGDKIIDVKIEYPKSFFEQMVEYGQTHSFLPVKN